MSDQTRRKTPSNLPHPEDLEEFILTEPEPIEIAEGYSLSIEYDRNGRPQIYIKKYGDIDTRGLRRKIERSYPGATIQGLEKLKRIEMATTQTAHSQNQKAPKGSNEMRKRRKKQKEI